MPYLQVNWIRLLSGKNLTSTRIQQQQQSKDHSINNYNQNQPPDGGKVIRTTPFGEYDGNNTNLFFNGHSNCGSMTTMELTRLRCLSNIVKSQIEELNSLTTGLSTKDESFYRYSISVDMVVFTGTYSNIYFAYHQDHPELMLIGRVYEPTAKINPRHSFYIKILKHLGKRHHSLIGTWDVFYDCNGRVVIFQEFALYGNMQEYIKQKNVFVPEAQMIEWAQQIYLGMDFLGDAGLCHRAINPKHILLTSLTTSSDNLNNSKILAKLGSFRDAVVYYDSSGGDGNSISIHQYRYQPCRPVDKRSDFPYHAPEVFGDPATEHYDPICADVWSFGATFFVASARAYPCRYSEHRININNYKFFDSTPLTITNEIEKSIDGARNLSQDAKQWFKGLLCANVSQRTPFDKIESDPWYKTFQPQKQ